MRGRRAHRDHLHRRDGRNRWTPRGRGIHEQRARDDAQPVALGDGRIRSGDRCGRDRRQRTHPSLDPTFCSPGQFDRTVEIPLPNQAERRAILVVHTQDLEYADMDLDVVAARRGTWVPTSPTWWTRRSTDAAPTATSSAPTTSAQPGSRLPAQAGTDAMERAPARREAQRRGPRDPATRWWPRSSEHADPVAKVTIPPCRRGARCDPAAPGGRTASLAGKTTCRTRWRCDSAGGRRRCSSSARRRPVQQGPGQATNLADQDGP